MLSLSSAPLKHTSPRRRSASGIALAGMMALAGLASTPLEAAPPKPQLPAQPTPTLPPNYSGTYDLTYIALDGNVELCVSLGPQRVCEPIVIDIPLYNGLATEDSLLFILDYLDSSLTELAPNLPEELYPTYDTLVQTLFPVLVEELNLVLTELPSTMTVRERTGSPIFTTQMTVNGIPMVMPGQIDVSTGVFALKPEVMLGQIFSASSFRGAATQEVPVRISESIGFETPAGSPSTLAVSIYGVLGADLRLARQ